MRLKLIDLNIHLFDVESLDPEELESRSEPTLLINTVTIGDKGTRQIQRQIMLDDDYSPMDLPRLIHEELMEVLARHYD